MARLDLDIQIEVKGGRCPVVMMHAEGEFPIFLRVVLWLEKS